MAPPYDTVRRTIESGVTWFETSALPPSCAEVRCNTPMLDGRTMIFYFNKVILSIYKLVRAYSCIRHTIMSFKWQSSIIGKSNVLIAGHV